MDNERVELLREINQLRSQTHLEHSKRCRLIKDVKFELDDALMCLENREVPNIQMAINRLRDIQKALVKWGN